MHQIRFRVFRGQPDRKFDFVFFVYFVVTSQNLNLKYPSIRNGSSGKISSLAV